jgi:hypothetical protein
MRFFGVAWPSNWTSRRSVEHRANPWLIGGIADARKIFGRRKPAATSIEQVRHG